MSTNVNPYASPVIPTAERVPMPATGYVVSRASEKTIRGVNSYFAVANVLYPINFIFCAVTVFGVGLPRDFSNIMLVAYIVTGFVLWFSLIATSFSCGRIAAGILTTFVFFLPIIGSFAFCIVLDSTKGFMIRNGYRAKLFGFVPDEEDRQRMSDDPMYLPHQKLRHDGSARKSTYLLSECFLGLLICVFGVLSILFIASVVLAPLFG